MFNFHFHTQDLSRESGRYLNKRGWISLKNSYKNLLRWEYCSGWVLSCSVECDEENDMLGFSLGIIYFQIFIFFAVPFSIDKDSYLSCYIHDYTFWVTTEDYTYVAFSFLDFLFGKNEVTWKTIEEAARGIIFPEKIYPLSIKLKIRTDERPRLKARYSRCVEIECKEGILIPGKGENSWDCGDDSWYGYYGPAETVAEGVDKLFEDVKRRRERYGGGLSMYVKKGEEVRKNDKDAL